MSDLDAVRAIPVAELGAVGDYLSDCLDRGLRPRTVLAKYRFLTRLQHEVGDLEQATAADLKAWWQGTRRRKLAEVSRGVYLSHVRAFYAWLVLEERRDDSPAARLRFPKRHRSVPRDVDPSRVLAIIDRFPRGSREWLALTLMLRCGLRCCEAAPVRPSTDLITRANGRAILRVEGKGGHQRDVPVPTDLAAALASVEGWCFPSTRADHWRPETVSRFVGDLLRACGLDATAHQLRHTFATGAYQLTGDVVDLQQVLGHSSIAVTNKYVRSLGTGVAGVIDDLFSQAG